MGAGTNGGAGGNNPRNAFSLGDGAAGPGDIPNNPDGSNGGNAGGNGAIDPAALSPDNGTSSGATGKRGRGRPKGSGAKPQTASQVSVTGVETILFNIHGMVAAATGFDQISLTQGEASDLAKAVANVAQYYPTKINAKHMAWINLGMVAGAIYGTRVVAYVAMQTVEKPDPSKLHVLRTQ